MKKTGQLLRDAREAKGISLQEVSIHLKISTRTLKALEEGDKAQLPAKTFLRGFVQSYSQFLKINLQEVMSIFQEEMGTTHPGMITTQVAQPPSNYSAPTSPATPNQTPNQNSSAQTTSSTSQIQSAVAGTTSTNEAQITEQTVQHANVQSADVDQASNAEDETDVSADINSNASETQTSQDSHNKKHSKNKKNKKNKHTQIQATTANIANTFSLNVANETVNKTSNLSVTSTSASASGSSNKISEPVAPVLSIDPKTWSNSLRIGTVVLVIVIISIIVTIKKTVDKYEREATLPTSQIAVDSLEKKNPEASPLVAATTNSATTNAKEPAPSGSPNPTQENNQAHLDNNTKSFTSDVSNSAISLTTKSNQAPLSSAQTTTPNTNSALSALVPKSNPNPNDDAIKNSVSTGTGSISADSQNKSGDDIKTQEVIIEALDKVSVEFTIDGGGKETISLQAEKLHTFKAKKHITLTISDGGSINLIYNGKDKGVPGNLGQAYTVSFPQ